MRRKKKIQEENKSDQIRFEKDLRNARNFWTGKSIKKKRKKFPRRLKRDLELIKKTCAGDKLK